MMMRRSMQCLFRAGLLRYVNELLRMNCIHNVAVSTHADCCKLHSMYIHAKYSCSIASLMRAHAYLLYCSVACCVYCNHERVTAVACV